MKKRLSLLLLGTVLLTTGCARSGGMETGGFGSPSVVQSFKQGIVISQNKVILEDNVGSTGIGALAGGAIGALAGGKSGNGLKGAGIGALAGAGLGYATGQVSGANEKESYETVIRGNDGMTYKVFLNYKLRENTAVEYVDRGNGEITNVHQVSR